MRKSDSAANTPTAQEGEAAKLDSWKEIAAYLKRDVRTVQRWESTEGLPAHRHVHLQRSSVYAFTGELDAWWSSRKQALEQATTESRGARGLWPYAALAALLGVGVAGWLILRVPTADEQFTVRPLTGGRGKETTPAFSPDGSKIAYAWTREDEDYSDIYVTARASGGSIQITNTPGAAEFSPVWSPNGDWIAFFGYRDGKRWLLVMPALGGAERRITAVHEYQYDLPGHWLCWTPDGRTLIFPDRNHENDSIALYAISIAGGEKWRLTQPASGSVDTSPSVSADGSTLAFLRGLTAALACRIFLAPLSASVHLVGSPTPLEQETNVVEQVSWIGHERTLAYLYPWTSKGTKGLWRLRVDGHSRPRLVFPIPTLTTGSTYTRLSPDGRCLAFSGFPLNNWFGRAEILDHPVQEVHIQRITGSAVDLNPNFSPDGGSLTYASIRSGHPEIWTSRADGSQPNRITHMEGPLTGTPRWSSDGTRIAFDSSPNFNADIWIVNADGGTPVRLTTEPSAEFNPSWSRDDKWIYFTSNRTGRHEMWRAPSAGGPAHQITRHGGFGGFESPDGRYLYYGTTYRLPELRRIPVEGGNEETLVPRFHGIHYLRISRTGAYFLLPCSGCQLLKQAWELQRFRFSDGKVEAVMRFRARIAMGLAVSPDESFVVLSLSDKVSGNITLVEGLR